MLQLQAEALGDTPGFGSLLAEAAYEIARRNEELWSRQLSLITAEFKTLAERWRQWDRQLATLAPQAEELGRRGWTLPARLWITAVADIVDHMPAEQLNDWWLDRYAADGGEELEELITGLAASSMLDPWRRMLDGAIVSYRDGYYETAIPALIVVFDGTFATAADGLESEAQVRQAAVKFRNTAERTMALLSWASLVGFTDVIFRPHPFWKAPPTSY